ncbi:MAG: ACT domain-containing protein [Planctomycetales bacterium]|nr:ACT domain-containing protein [Planctomycetales bacterium]
METRTQISMFLENRPGALERVCRALSEHKLNILGFTVNDAIDHAVVRMVVDDGRKAAHVLGEHEVLCIEADVLEVPLGNRPGALAEVAGALKGAGININYAYGTTGTSGGGVVYVHSSDPSRARRVLEQAGVK